MTVDYMPRRTGIDKIRAKASAAGEQAANNNMDYWKVELREALEYRFAERSYVSNRDILIALVEAEWDLNVAVDVIYSRHKVKIGNSKLAQRLEALGVDLKTGRMEGEALASFTSLRTIEVLAHRRRTAAFSEYLKALKETVRTEGGAAKTGAGYGGLKATDEQISDAFRSGLSDDGIAEKFGMSPETVRKKRVKLKLHHKKEKRVS